MNTGADTPIGLPRGLSKPVDGSMANIVIVFAVCPARQQPVPA
jgi:hypothetical protein